MKRRNLLQTSAVLAATGIVPLKASPKDVPVVATTADAEIDRGLRDMARHWAHPMRSPILKTPADCGLEFEDISFPSQDGVPLEAWFLPAPGSRKLIIVNHPNPLRHA